MRNRIRCYGSANCEDENIFCANTVSVGGCKPNRIYIGMGVNVIGNRFVLTRGDPRVCRILGVLKCNLGVCNFLLFSI